jgi:hypothetical protein
MPNGLSPNIGVSPARQYHQAEGLSWNNPADRSAARTKVELRAIMTSLTIVKP